MEVTRMTGSEKKKSSGMSVKARRVLAYIVLIFIVFLCLFWFYILIINAPRWSGWR